MPENLLTVYLEIPYDEVKHLKLLVDVAQHDCLSCQALQIHLSQGLKETMKKKHQTIERANYIKSLDKRIREEQERDFPIQT